MDVDTSMISWKINGKEISKGIGQKNLSVTAGAVGTSIPVVATVSDAFGNVVTASIIIVPQSVSLVWEAIESYVPAFYEGKPLPAEGSSIKVTAVPATSESLSSLSFGWYVNNTYLENSSGAGRRSAIIPLETLADHTEIKVRVKTPLGAVMEKTISIYPHEVMPLLYTHDDLLGTDFTQTFIRRLELTKAVTLSVEPYYLSTKKMESTASYSWYLDGLPVATDEKGILALKPKEDSYGVRTITVLVAQARRKLQSAQTSLQAVFDTRQ
jgi:hypothetical protein